MSIIMPMTSRTGLLPSERKKIKIQVQAKTTVEILTIAEPAPYVLRPFAGVYNPFPHGCSILCNHPADREAKNVVRKAKDAWANEGRALLAMEEFEMANKSHLQQQQSHKQSSSSSPHRRELQRISPKSLSQTNICDDSVPEELFRKYTDTDSRPLTPAPTVASVVTKVSQARRCVTPDPVPSLPTRERTLLVLDLRRSHSQETLTWQCQQLREAHNAPQVELQMSTKDPSRAASSSSPNMNKKKKLTKKKITSNAATPSSSIKMDSPTEDKNEKDANHNKLQQTILNNVKSLTVPEVNSLESGKKFQNLGGSGGSSGETEIVKRRGKKRKGKKTGRDAIKEGEKEFQGIPDPGETQVSTLGNESRSGSNRPSLTPGTIPEDEANLQQAAHLDGLKSTQRLNVSFLDSEILRQLQRQLDQEIVDSELDVKRRIALEEAYRFRPNVRHTTQGEEMKMLKKELQLPINNPEKWLSIPRVFTRQSARFEVPMDSRRLNTMTPLEYAQNYVFASAERLVLYNHVFNLHREELEDDDEETKRILLGKNVIKCLGEIMGRAMTDEEGMKFQKLLGWTDSMSFDFRTFAGVSAICERLLGVHFCSKMPTHEQDPRHEIEQADFESLDRKLFQLNPDERIVEILKGIRDL